MKTDVDLSKVDGSDTSRPLAGAKFSLYKDDGDGAFDRATDKLVFADRKTGADGKVTFPRLTVGTYFLVETYTPAGYQINDEVFRIRVFDVAGQAGGAAGNMIQVGKADGANMLPPGTPNTITVADKPTPSMPSTGGPGVVGLMAAGGCLAVSGTSALLDSLRRRRKSR